MLPIEETLIEDFDPISEIVRSAGCIMAQLEVTKDKKTKSKGYRILEAVTIFVENAANTTKPKGELVLLKKNNI
jgi:hypothetical protein